MASFIGVNVYDDPGIGKWVLKNFAAPPHDKNAPWIVASHPTNNGAKRLDQLLCDVAPDKKNNPDWATCRFELGVDSAAMIQWLNMQKAFGMLFIQEPGKTVEVIARGLTTFITELQHEFESDGLITLVTMNNGLTDGFMEQECSIPSGLRLRHLNYLPPTDRRDDLSAVKRFAMKVLRGYGWLQRFQY